MKVNYRFKLFIVLIAFSFVITTVTMTINYLKLKEQFIYTNELQVEQAIETVQNALASLDKAYMLLDHGNNKAMEENMALLQKKYAENPNFDSWNFQALTEKIENDIYIINDKNVIVYSNLADDLGLDFSVCCKNFEKLLNDRRATGELYIDGLDIEQNTGDLKQYSYMATPDKKFLIELGFNLEDKEVFREYNFLSVIEDLIEGIPVLEEINVINYGGFIFGNQDGDLTIEQRQAFEEARSRKEMVEVEGIFHNKRAIIRYVPVISDYDMSNSRLKVLEIIYNENSLEQLLKENRKLYFIQLFLVLIVTSVLSMFISRQFARPMYLAYHDSLTNLKNRTSFDEDLQDVLKNENKNTHLLMLDIDNFKLINDTYGHAHGDKVLECIANIILEVIEQDSICYRIGGDEFIVLMSKSTLEDARLVAEKIINNFNNADCQKKRIGSNSISVSIGISSSKNNQDPKLLLRQADIALYKSKEKGKNQYQIYLDKM